MGGAFSATVDTFEIDGVPMAEFAVVGVICLSVWGEGEGRMLFFLSFFIFCSFVWGDVVLGVQLLNSG